MKLFKEEIEFRRTRNRHYRFGKWGGLLIKIMACIAIFMIIRTFSGKNIEYFFWFFNINNTRNVHRSLVYPE